MGSHDVHHHTRWVHGLAARNVKSDPVDRLPALDDLGAGTEGGHGARGNLRLGCDAHARDRLFEGGTHRGVEGAHGPCDLLGVNADAVGANAVEPLRLVEQRFRTARAHVRDEVGGRGGGDGDIRQRAGNEVRELGTGGLAVAQIDRVHHGVINASWRSP